jgi:hypothetical protein
MDFFQKINTNTSKTALSNFVDGEQMRNIMHEVHEELKKKESEEFLIKPIDKQLHLKMKEIAINYEISLEIRRSQFTNIKDERKKACEKCKTKKINMETKMDNLKNVIHSFMNTLITHL